MTITLRHGKRVYASDVSIRRTPPAQRRLRSKGGPFCSDLGKYRKELWRGKGFFFCHGCDLWDKEDPCNGRVNRNSTKFKCTAHHTSYVYPTERLKHGGLFNPSKNPACRQSVDSDETSVDGDSEDDGDDESDGDRKDDENDEPDGGIEDEADGDRVDEGGQDWQAIATKLKKSNDALRQDLCRMRNKIERTAVANTTMPLTASKKKAAMNATFRTSIMELLDEYNKKWFPKWGRKRKGKVLAEAFWECMDGVAQDELMKLAKAGLRKGTFHPFKVLRAMDFAGGTLSYEGIDVLRQCETSGKKCVRGGILPCSATLRRMAGTIEKFGDAMCPVTHSTTEDGEMFAFDFKKTVPMIVGAHGLHKAAQSGAIGMAQSIDGAQISEHCSMVMAGVKINDFRAHCPFTKRPLVAGNEIEAGVYSPETIASHYR
jgi:hypothetical protein